MIAVFAVRDPLAMAALFIITAALYAGGQIPFSSFWGNLRAFFWLYVITFTIHLFLHPGNALWQLPLVGWEVTTQGLTAAVLFTLRIAVLVSVSTLLMAVTTPQDLTDGLERMLKPLARWKLPVSEGALMVSITLRFVPILIQEAQKIQQAQTARGADLEGSWIVRLRKIIPMILPLFFGALRKADHLAVALEARGYRGGAQRTHLYTLRFKTVDWLILCFTAALTFAFALW